MPDPIVSYESPDGKIVDIAMSESKTFEDNNIKYISVSGNYEQRYEKTKQLIKKII